MEMLNLDTTSALPDAQRAQGPEGPVLAREDLPSGVAGYLSEVEKKGASNVRYTLRELFTGADASAIESVRSRGWAELSGPTGQRQVIGVDLDSTGNVLAVAAAIPRNPSKSMSYVQTVQDFAEDTMQRDQKIALFHRIYNAEGLVANAINKASGLISTQGSFRVRYVKGKRGKPTGKTEEEFRMLLQFWAENVNAREVDAVATGSRGVDAFLAQGSRQALIEGDHVFRTNWQKVAVPALSGAQYSLPINIQSFSSANIEIPEELAGTSLELIYWVPPSKLVDSLKSPKDKNVKQALDKLIPKDVQSALKKDGKYLLDPSLMFHVRHRGLDTRAYGMSMIEPVVSDIAYKRQLQALDQVTINNLINRLTIIKVGLEDRESPYHKAEISAARLKLLERMMRQVGPGATILWGGPDIDVVDVGAHDKILEMDGRYQYADARIRNSLGVPAALLTGEGTDGKAAGWAAGLGLAAQLKEVQNQYRQVLRRIAEKIAEENGFEDVDVTWEFHSDILADKEANANVALKAYQAGVLPTRIIVEELGYSYEAIQVLQAEDVALGYKQEPFGAPNVMLTDNPAGNTGDQPTGGRPKVKETGEPDPRADQEKKSPVENK